ncbi:MAG: hypothetical protein H8D45_32385 [Bacteroidetes bacterium]|nr:hypothetical protein [Bacteroidota bacterium]
MKFAINLSAKYIIIGAYINSVSIFCQFPLTGLMDVKPKRFSELPKSVFDIVHDYEFEGHWDRIRASAYLDSAKFYGFKVLMGIDRNVVLKVDKKIIKRIIQALKNHPALWGWYISDEPELRGISPKHIAEINRLIQIEDLLHPTVITLNKPESFGHYSGTVDIILTDFYPIPKFSLSDFSQRVSFFENSMKNGESGYVIQAYDKRYYRNKEGFHQRPSLEEERYMILRTLIKKPKVILFFSLHASNTEYIRLVTVPAIKSALDLWREIGEFEAAEPELNMLNDSCVEQFFFQFKEDQKTIFLNPHNYPCQIKLSNWQYRNNGELQILPLFEPLRREDNTIYLPPYECMIFEW